MDNDAFKGILIGGGATLVGGLLGQMISVLLHYLDKQKEKTKLLRDKCELISEYYCKTGLWWAQLSTCYTFWDLKACTPPLTATQAAMLSSMYFPKLAKPTSDYYESLSDFYNFLVDNSPMVAGPATIIASIIKNKNREFEQHNARIDKAKKEAQDAIASQARALLKS